MDSCRLVACLSAKLAALMKLVWPPKIWYGSGSMCESVETVLKSDHAPLEEYCRSLRPPCIKVTLAAAAFEGGAYY
jgi:hypothetical protein